MAGSQMGLQGAGMQLTAEQARAQAAAQAVQTGLAGIGQNVAAQQASGQAIGQSAGLGLQGAGQMLAAQQAAGQLGLAGAQTALQGQQQQLGGLQAGGQLGLAGAGLGLQGAQAAIGATEAAAQQGLSGILGGGQLNLASQIQGGQLALQGNQQGQQANVAASTLAMQAEAQRAQNEQYNYNLQQANIANDLQIAGMQAGLNVQNAGFANQIGGGLLGAAGAAGAGVATALSDIRAKENIEPADSLAQQSNLAGLIGGNYAQAAAGANAGQSPTEKAGLIGADYAQQAMKQNTDLNAANKAKNEKLGDSIGNLSTTLQTAFTPTGDLNVNPITGQPWFLSDERMKQYASSDKRGKAGESSDSDALDAFANAPGYSYEYKDPGAPGAAPGRHFGPMAQDLERTPAGASVVEEGPDGRKMVNAPRLTMLEASAISALTDKIQKLEARIGAGKSKSKKAA
jgi:hypothetical protein